MKTLRLLCKAMLLIAIGWLVACGPVNPEPSQNPGNHVDPGTTPPPQVDYYCKAELPDIQVFSRGAAAVSFILETNIEEFSIKVRTCWTAPWTGPTSFFLGTKRQAWLERCSTGLTAPTVHFIDSGYRNNHYTRLITLKRSAK